MCIASASDVTFVLRDLGSGGFWVPFLLGTLRKEWLLYFGLISFRFHSGNPKTHRCHDYRIWGRVHDSQNDFVELWIHGSTLNNSRNHPDSFSGTIFVTYRTFETREFWKAWKRRVPGNAEAPSYVFEKYPDLWRHYWDPRLSRMYWQLSEDE